MEVMNERVHIIGVTGTAGSGKDTVSDLLCELFDFHNMSTGDWVRALTRHAYNLPSDFNPVRDQLYVVANFVRSIDPAFFVKMAIFQGEQQGFTRILISGLRSMGEADAVRAAGGVILAVDTDPRVRYDRIYARGRDSEAQKTFEAFMEQDALENKGLADTGPARGIQYIVEGADITIGNSGSMDDLKQELHDKVAPVLNR